MKEYNFKINGNDYSVSINKVEDGCAEVTVNGTEFQVEFESDAPAKPKSKIVQVAPDLKAVAAAASTVKPAVAKPVSASGGSVIKSPLPGVILDLKVAVGDTIKTGQRLLILEAMKMENNIDSDRDGVIKAINVNKGDSVLEGDVLITIE